LINRKTGSWFFLAVILTNLDLEFDKPAKNLCGSCKRCIEACPTKALIEPYLLDSGKCISYLTIEHKGNDLPQEYQDKMENWIFGCDICQEVCPWNKFASQTSVRDFIPAIDHSPDLNILLEMRESEFKTVFSDSPIKRTKYSGFIRNIKFILKKEVK
jgi:epoxyqueuosine reductase